MKKSKTIWVLLRSHVVNLPPVITVIQCLLDSKEYKVKFVSTQESGLDKENFQEFILPQSHKVNKLRKLKNYIDYRSFVKKTLSKFASKDDLIWLGSLDTARACKGLEFLETNEYILQLHELYDTHRDLLESIKPIAKKAKKVVSPEENRAAILQVWLGLKERPVVLPNKPYSHPRTRKMQPTHELTKKILANVNPNNKVIIYQGHISKDRSLEPVIEAIQDIENVEFWLMGPDHNYVNELISKSDKVKYLGYVPAPYHLEITSYADLGIMSYDLVNLNNLYCAPNKVWEYLGFNINFLCNNILSLKELEKYGLCCLIDFSDTNQIKTEIEFMLNEKINACDFYDNLNLSSIIKDLVGDF